MALALVGVEVRNEGMRGTWVAQSLSICLWLRA